MSVEAKESVFVEFFGRSPFIRTLDFFLEYPIFDYSKTQIAREIGISRITIEKIWKTLVEKGLIFKTREMGRAEMYQLNRKNPVVKRLMKFCFDLASDYFDREMEEEKLAVKLR